jgi:VWFA-related protein
VRRIILGVSLALALAAALFSGGLSAQPQQPIRVGTNFVRVDAYPTKDGRVVDGLAAPDFEVLEDGVPQKIETFEHVIGVRGPQTARTEPSSQRDMVQALANPRSRVFLLFLDGPFVDDTSARQINEPLIRFLTTELADDDLVGVMTPSMSASQVAFGKKTEVFAEGVRSAWLGWGRQNRELDGELDKREIQYTLCYPGFTDVPGKMVARSRERKTLESLQDAVKYLASVREERKAIIAVTEGWVLYREDPDLMRQRGTQEAPLGVDKMRVGPTGKLTLEDTKTSVNALSPAACDGDRAYLAAIDNDKFLRDVIEDANRGNSSFYMIDPGGLKVKSADRSGAMRTLAENTDGLAVLNTNDLDRGLNRIAQDMASYYLLGYYASNTKPDGRFRNITVRVKQPGVAVRARKGYRAPGANDINVPAAIKNSPATAAPTPVQAALDQLGRSRPTARFRVDAIVGPGPMRSLWVVGELRSATSRPDEFALGGTAAVQAVAGSASTTGTVALKPGQRVFVTRLDLPSGASGNLDVRVRLTSEEAAGEPLSEGVRVDLNAADPRPLMLHRGPTTGPQLAAAADPVFSRTERVRLEFPVGPGPRDGKPGSGRVIDRGSVTTQVPVSVAERTEEGTGQRWITADVSLAALSPGDYAIEVVILKESKEVRLLTPIRVVR